jgi:RimJ/RimL family protein N-acetyltransferase
MSTSSTTKYFSGMTFAGYGIELRPITPCDLPSLRRWRNSPKIKEHMLDKSYIGPRQQRLWFEGVKKRADQAHWVVWSQGVRTGYVNVHGEGDLVRQKQVSGGYYIADTPGRHGLLGYAATLMYHDVVFEYILADLIIDTILKANKTARQLNAQIGYCEGVEEDGVSIRVTLHRSDYEEAKKKRFLRRFKDFRCVLIQESIGVWPSKV